MSSHNAIHCETQRRTDAQARRPLLRTLASSSLRVALIAILFAFTGACRMDMQDQPRHKPYRASGFFDDSLLSRPLNEGTVPRGYLREDTHLYTGRMLRGQGAPGASSDQTTAGQQNQTGRGVVGKQAGAGQSATAGQTGGANSQTAAAFDPDLATTFPFTVTAEVVQRGRERYDIFCAMCHGATGNGDGLVVRRGYRRPPSYHDDRLRQAPVGHFYDVITNGWGAMPEYSGQVPVQDRWAIIAYIRALQMTHVGAAESAPAGQTSTNQTGGQR